MIRTTRLFRTIVLAAATLAPLVIASCAARVRIYDDYHADYHYWNDREDRAYHMWLAERHYEYRDYHHLDHDQQRDYWNWRHHHPDSGR